MLRRDVKNLVLICGGSGKRLGGIEKPLMRICEKPILEMLIERFHHFNIVISCSRKNVHSYTKFSRMASIVVDVFENTGPSAGIYSALKFLYSNNKSGAVFLAGDMPFVKKSVVEHLYTKATKLNVDALIPVWKDGKKEPLLAYYKASNETINAFRNSIISGKRRILQAVSKMKKVSFIEVEELRQFDDKLISFFNINTFEDLKRAEELCSSIGLGEE